jgi:flavin-dependent dehydrogenase
MCAGARTISEATARMVVGSAPDRVTMTGFMGLGDAITPGGYLGILPAVYLGRQAALVAIEAIDAGDTSANRLALYEHLYRQRMLPDLKSEYRTLVALANMPDGDLDTFCQTLGDQRLALPFSAQVRAIEWDTIGSRGKPAASSQPPLQPEHPLPMRATLLH